MCPVSGRHQSYGSNSSDQLHLRWTGTISQESRAEDYIPPGELIDSSNIL